MGEEHAAELSLTTEQMRRLGHEVIDMIIDHLEALPDTPLHNPPEPAELQRTIDGGVRREPTPPADALEELRRTVLPHMMSVHHPRFFAFVPSPSNFVSTMGDALASGLNVFANTWIEAAGSTTTELALINWLRGVCGLPEGAGGIFTSGGSMANVTGLAAARHTKLGDDFGRGVAYGSDQTHSSVPRGLRLLDFRADQYVEVPSDSAYRIDLGALRAQIEDDRRHGRQPFCVVANAGTTNTGAIDPFEELAAISREHDLWLHVDGAYGAAAAITEEGRRLLAGLGLVDSIALDPHKWLFQPYEIGCLLVRDRRLLRDTFFTQPDYLADTAGDDAAVNQCEYGPELTRGYRGLKLWLSLRVFGLAAFKRAIEHGLELAKRGAEEIERLPDWELCAPASLGIMAFRFAPAGVDNNRADAINLQLVSALLDDGLVFVTSSRLRGRAVLRLCPINPRTTEADVVGTLRRLDELAGELKSKE